MTGQERTMDGGRVVIEQRLCVWCGRRGGLFVLPAPSTTEVCGVCYQAYRRGRAAALAEHEAEVARLREAIRWLTDGHCEEGVVHHLLPYEPVLWCAIPGDHGKQHAELDISAALSGGTLGNAEGDIAEALKGMPPVRREACAEYINPDGRESPSLQRIGAPCARCGHIGPAHVRSGGEEEANGERQ